MPHYVAFLRGINLGRRRIKMDRLRAEFVALKFDQVDTFIASGNVLFASRQRDALALGRRIETHLLGALGYPVDTFVRTRSDVATLAALRPFPPADMDPPENTIHCGFLREPLSAAQTRGLLACRTAVDEFRVIGREYFWLCRRIKSHESKIWSSPELRALKLPSSSLRNLTTIRRLAVEFPAAAD